MIAEIDSYFADRRDFECLGDRTDQELAERLALTDERIKFAESLNGDCPNELKIMLRQDATQLRNEQQRRRGERRNTQAPAAKILFETMTEVEEEEIDWLWNNRIPRGKLTLFDGDPGTGKSYTSLAITAALSNGLALPYDKEPEAPLNSWIISAEDGAADTIKPRLRKLGADMDMIAIPKRQRQDGCSESLSAHGRHV